MISYLALGTNLGDRQGYLSRALALICMRVGTILRQSSVVETEPVGFASENKFLNMCIAVDTPLTPHELLRATQDIERALGRTAKSANQTYHDREIDIDILLYGDITLDEESLQIPHPRMTEREFVMKPLSEIKR